MMMDLRSQSLKRKLQESKKKKEEQGTLIDDYLSPEQLEARALAKKFEDKLEEESDEVRTQTQTGGGVYPSSPKKESVFDFLTTEDFIDFFQKNLVAYHTPVDPNNPRSRTTLLSQKKFLENVKLAQPSNEELQRQSQSSFYKWLCRNGYGTKEQITNYYKSRAKEKAIQIKRDVQLADLVSQLKESPDLIDELFESEYFVSKIRKIIQGG